MIDLAAMMNKAQELQNQFKEDLERMAVTGASAGGSVRVVVNGHKEITNIEFQDQALEDPDRLADLVLAAVSGAYAEIDRKLKDRLPSALNSLNLPEIKDLFQK